MNQLSLREFARNPVTLVVGGFSAATALLQVTALKVIGLYLWTHVGEVFTLVSLAGFTVAPNVGFIPENPLIVAAVLTGVVYGLKKLYEMLSEIDQQLES